MILPTLWRTFQVAKTRKNRECWPRAVDCRAYPLNVLDVATQRRAMSFRITCCRGANGCLAVAFVCFCSFHFQATRITVQYSTYWNEPGDDKFERSKSVHRLLDWWYRFWWCPTFARSNPIFAESPCFQCLFLAPHYWYYCLCRWPTFCSQEGRDWGAEWDRSRTKPHHLPLRSYIWISGLGCC